VTTKDGRPQKVSDEEIVDTVANAFEEGDTDLLDGGVPAEEVADRVGYHVGTVEDRLRALVDDGRLVQVDGANPETYHSRISYKPADTPTSGVES